MPLQVLPSHTFLAVAAVTLCFGPWVQADALQVSPPQVALVGPESAQQLLVTSTTDASVDLTHKVSYRTLDHAIARVTSAGRVLPVTDGTTTLEIAYNGTTLQVPVEVHGCANPAAVSFRQEITPILSKAGCNSGGCHGKAEGQNGFKLSVFGFAPEADHDAIVKEGRGRRISIASPDRSLLLLKGTAELPHGGGLKLHKDSLWYRRLLRWIEAGARLDDQASRSVVRIEVEPAQQTLAAQRTQQLRVTAIDSEGRRYCVTHEAEYESNAADVADVDRDGLVTTSDIPGEAAILVRYMGHVAVSRLTMPQPQTEFARPTESNFIDQHVWDKLTRLRIAPSDRCDDATFFRRVSLDITGTLPTAAEARAFLANPSADKRAAWVDELLTRDAYADFWAMKWADILRVDKSIVTPQGAVGMTRWLRQQLADNQPYDTFARQIVTARGNTLSQSPAAFFQVHKDAEMAARSVSQVFLGVRLECAQCHHHPMERWSQTDYYAFANYFVDVGRTKGTTGGTKIVWQAPKPLKHPRTGEIVLPAALGSPTGELDDLTNRRAEVAKWMTADDNPYFARMIANRLWAHYFGRGLVEPIDDMRATNPATNEPLLEALAEHLRSLNYDLKQFTKTLVTSQAYQRTARAIPANELDAQNYSHASWKPLAAEVLLDAICQVTDVPEQFNGWPLGYRAIEIWDNRMPSYFFRVFGRPQRVSVCECERGNEPSIAQALHLMNSPETVHKLRHRDGLAKQLAESDKTPSQIIEALYLAAFSRHPTPEEQTLMLEAFTESPDNRRAATEDVLWTLLNTREFIYNH